jgi:hypothetical protein
MDIFYLRLLNLKEELNSKTKKKFLQWKLGKFIFRIKSRNRLEIVKEIERLTREIPPSKG